MMTIKVLLVCHRYTYIHIYICVYMCVWELCGYITLCAVDRFHFMHFAKRWTQFFIIASLCAFFLCHFPFEALSIDSQLYGKWWQREFYSFQLFWLYKYSPGTRTEGTPAVHQLEFAKWWIYCFDASLCTLCPPAKVSFAFNIIFFFLFTVLPFEKHSLGSKSNFMFWFVVRGKMFCWRKKVFSLQRRSFFNWYLKYRYF